MRSFLALLMIGSLGIIAAPESAAAQDASACNNASYFATEHAHANRTEVTFCGTVVRLRAARRTRSGRHRYIFVDPGDRNPIEIDANLDVMGDFPVRLGESAVVRGEYYYDTNGREGVHWTHRSDRGRHPAGYLILDGTTYN